MEQAIFPALLSFWITMFLYIADSNILAIYSYRQSGGNTVSHSYHLPSMYCLCVIKNCQLSLRGLVVSLLWQSMFSHFPTCICIFTVLPAASRCIEYLINISVYIYVCVCVCVCAWINRWNSCRVSLLEIVLSSQKDIPLTYNFGWHRLMYHLKSVAHKSLTKAT